MEHSPSREGNKSPPSQEIPCTLWNLEVHHRIHKLPAAVPNLSLINAVHVSPSHFFKIHFSNILPSTPLSSKWPLSYLFISYISLQSSVLDVNEKPKEFTALRNSHLVWPKMNKCNIYSPL